jgi:hypothetical protein
MSEIEKPFKLLWCIIKFYLFFYAVMYLVIRVLKA